MENFNSWFSKPVDYEDVELWFNANNIIIERIQLYYDFTISLLNLMNKTYLGFDNDIETKISLNNEDNANHFKWCWDKTVQNFKKENIDINVEGSHYDYFMSFFQETFYSQESGIIREGLLNFFKDLFDINKTFTKADIDLLTDLYKTMEKNINHQR